MAHWGLFAPAGVLLTLPYGLAQRLGLFSKVGKRAEDLLRDIPTCSTVEMETPTVTLDDGSLL